MSHRRSAGASTTSLPYTSYKGLPWVIGQLVRSEITANHETGAEEQNRDLCETFTLHVPPGIPVDGTHITTTAPLLLPSSRGTVVNLVQQPRRPPTCPAKPLLHRTGLERDTHIPAARQDFEGLASWAYSGQLRGQTSTRGRSRRLDTTLGRCSDETIDVRIQRTGVQQRPSGGSTVLGEAVDVGGRVVGVEGLRVADTGIFPVPQKRTSWHFLNGVWFGVETMEWSILSSLRNHWQP